MKPGVRRDRRPCGVLNAGFLRRLAELGSDQAVAVTTVREAWKNTYQNAAPEGFVPDALAVLNPDYRAGLDAFDNQKPAEVQRIMTPLLSSPDPYVAANAAYFHARALIDLQRFEEAEAALTNLLAPEGEQRRLEVDQLTPFAPQLAFMRAVCQVRNLRSAEAARTLNAMADGLADAPESVRMGVRQLLIEIQRAEKSSLDEVADLMQYVADRLGAADGSDRVRQRQKDVLALLDKLIEDQQKQEQSQSSGGGKSSSKGKQARGRQAGKPQNPADQSQEAGQGEGSKDLHAAPRAEPGESWGALPPAEREKILQSIRDRFPSRYRQLVEQYYRSLAEEK